MPAAGQTQSIRERIERFAIPEPNSGCWLWQGGYDYRGPPFKPYGRIWVKGRTLQAHRVSWETYRGSIPGGMRVCHKCDTPLCVNPEHLFLGTPQDNTQDMIGKGRDEPTRQSRRGERSNFNKLRSEQVLAIRNDKRRLRVIAAEYGVTECAVSMIRLRKNWGWL